MPMRRDLRRERLEANRRGVRSIVRSVAGGLSALALAALLLGCGGEPSLPWSPTATPTATHTSTPSPTATITPSPTPTPHPLSIDWLRGRDYPGGPLTVEETLVPGANYDRYVVSYPSDGLKIRALLMVPRGETPAAGWPAIVFNHGYIAPAQYRTTERYVAYQDAFARAGYVVLKSDYRGHGSSEGEPRGGYGNQDYTVDVLNGLAALREDPRVDAERIGMWGHSMGGWITLRAMVVAPDIKAGVIWAGVVASYPDLLERWHRPRQFTSSVPARASSWRGLLTTEFGSPEERPELWAPLSANSYLDQLSGPIELHHGTNDSSVPVEFSEILVGQIEAVGGEVSLFTYAGDDHNIAANLGTALARSVAFFDRHVK